VGDAAAVLQAIAGYDALDVGSADVPVADYVSGLHSETKKLRIGIPRKHFYGGLDEEVRVAVERALLVIGELVAEVRDIEIDVSTDRTVQAAESFAYHAENVANRPELYQPETLRRIRSGENISAVEYIQRRREMDETRRKIGQVFADVDLLVTPTIPIPAELILLRNTRPFNVWGLPAISIPCGLTATGLQIGLQIAGAYWREDLVLRLAHAYERAVK
jgi:Asp-tRNA(Asn)/Glu-tRNA(Gln) amidotransferase A subunit family amidase